MKILIIDDDDLVLYTLSKILRSAGDTVVTAKNGARGMTAFRSEQPDLVITDIVMPEQEGLGTIMMLRRECPQARIIAISGGGRVGNLDALEAARTLGADEVIPKPFEADILLATVGRLRQAALPTAKHEAPGEALRRLATISRNTSGDGVRQC